MWYIRQNFETTIATLLLTKFNTSPPPPPEFACFFTNIFFRLQDAIQVPTTLYLVLMPALSPLDYDSFCLFLLIFSHDLVLRVLDRYFVGYSLT